MRIYSLPVLEVPYDMQLYQLKEKSKERERANKFTVEFDANKIGMHGSMLLWL